MAQNQSRLNLGEYAEEATIIQDEATAKSGVSFLEANTDAITMNELANKCVVPTWANQELTIAHQDFISPIEKHSKLYPADLFIQVKQSEAP